MIETTIDTRDYRTIGEGRIYQLPIVIGKFELYLAEL
jgi:hypothetical protein